MQLPEGSTDFAAELRRRWFRAMRTDKYARTKGVYGGPGAYAHCALGALRDEAIQLCRDREVAFPFRNSDDQLVGSQHSIKASIEMANVNPDLARLIENINDQVDERDQPTVRPFSQMVDEFLKYMPPAQRREIEADAVAA